jgi:hypothetical protein
MDMEDYQKQRQTSLSGEDAIPKTKWPFVWGHCQRSNQTGVIARTQSMEKEWDSKQYKGALTKQEEEK